MNTAQTQKSTGFEVSVLDDATTKQVTFNVAVIKDEDGEDLSGFKIVGKNSPEYQAANNAVRIENIQRASKRSKQIDSSTAEGAALLAKTVASNELTVALACVVDWFGFNMEGAPMDFDKNVVAKMFARYPQWQAMVSNALETDANFMKV
jgi:hypothetical protein